jgi:hypothetical protein
MQLSELELEVELSGVGDGSDLPIEDLRSHRAHLQATEAQVSFVRRMVQVRMDLLVAARETDDGDVETRRVDVLLAALPSLTTPATIGGVRRPPSQRAAVRPDDELLAEAETVAGVDISSLADQTPDEIDAALSKMSAYETRISSTRRRLHSLIDDIQSEIARRYSSGELGIGD